MNSPIACTVSQQCRRQRFERFDLSVSASSEWVTTGFLRRHTSNWSAVPQLQAFDLLRVKEGSVDNVIEGTNRSAWLYLALFENDALQLLD
jgi:hypothetical protein